MVDRQSISVGVGGTAVVSVAFGMSRYAYGLTLPDIREEFGLSELLLGVIASSTFAGYLIGLLCVPLLEARLGPRAPTTIGGVCGVMGAATVALAPTTDILVVGVVISGSAAGWVWAPYSDIVTRVVPRRHQAVVLAIITTGTSIGLMGLAALGTLAVFDWWRLTWVGISVAAVVATALNLRKVPRLAAQRAAAKGDRRSPWRRRMVPPLVYAVMYFAATTAYFTYAGEVGRGDGLPPASASLLFGVLGLGGLVAVGTGGLAYRLGPTWLGISSVTLVSSSLVLLAYAGSSLTLILFSAALSGMGFMVGSSLMAIWTAQVVPDRPGEAFTVALVIGAITSIVVPACMGALIPVVGRSQMLVLVAIACALGTMVLAAQRPVRRTWARLWVRTPAIQSMNGPGPT
ncbi:MAG: MFS transporter [Ornithinimicrobium sp.]